MLYLGVWLSGTGSNKPEVHARIAASWKRWTVFKRVCSHPDLTFRIRRLFFVSLVYSALISALEAVVLPDSELDKLTSFVCHRCRVLLLGKAYEVDDEHFVALSNAEVLRKCRTLPVHIELRLRRLTWLQSMSRSPEMAGALLPPWFAEAD